MKTFKIKLILLVLLTAMAVRAGASQKYSVSGQPSQIGYYVEHTVGFSSGQFMGFEGTILLSNDQKSLESVDVTIDADSLSTYNAEREKGLKGEDFLNVENYPQIMIKSKKITKDKITADVTVRGKTKEIVFDYGYYGVRMEEGSEMTMVAMKGSIDRRDFGVDYNVKSEKTGKDMLGTEFEITLYLNGTLAK
ncbi:MAG: YceI family protein [Candidatus Omnitrophota bacterium]